MRLDAREIPELETDDMQETGIKKVHKFAETAAKQSGFLQQIAEKQSSYATGAMADAMAQFKDKMTDMNAAAWSVSTPFGLADAWTQYMRDAWSRSAKMLDVMRQSADADAQHMAAGSPPLLDYAYSIIMDGAELPNPCNYILLEITPPTGIKIDPKKRPYVIIDPRAGHGAGIGGFKQDSQIGVALAKQHPVYFVAFRAEPEPGQTLADVCDAEAAFVTEVARRHPKSKKPIVIGNCQGGWATAVMAATHPEVTGPIVLNGAPMSYWAGNVGRYPMRYSAGVQGGLALTMMASDLGGGIYDGANLVLNFEQLNPSRNWFGKYYDLFRDVDKPGTAERFIDFERWWGAFYLLSDEEIRWIVEQLFVGNYLGRNQAQLYPGVPIDLKQINNPIICFASDGDNITPPAQALNWILDTYASEQEIKTKKQRIFYMLHDKVGHLGIFVSSAVARKQHKNMVSVLDAIEAVPPGLYEICIESETPYKNGPEGDAFEVSIAGRTFEQLADITGDRSDEAAFAGVARASEAGAELYETFLQPFVKAAMPQPAAKALRDAHPLRLRKRAFASNTPLGIMAQALACNLPQQRDALSEDNPFLKAERYWADAMAATMDLARDMKEAASEQTFFSLWATPWAMAYGAPNQKLRHQRRLSHWEDVPAVRDALASINDGGVAAAIMRLGLAYSRQQGSVQLVEIERIVEAFHTVAPFKSMSGEARAELLARQRLIVDFAPDQGLGSLKHLIKTAADRKTAESVLGHIFQVARKDLPAEVHAAWKEVVDHLNTATKTAAVAAE
ncbi:MAG: DUF3141 domain-containing protein [Pseudomonadota bacterium]